jgi:ribonuclease Z
MYSFRVLQNWSRDLFHSSLFQFDRKSYLFNCSDGTQRNAIDQGVKIHKLASIFYNSAHVDAYLGTYGLWMTRTEQVTGQLIAHETNQKEKKIDTIFENSKHITLWGPPGIRKNFKYCNGFFMGDKFKFIKEWSTYKNLFDDGSGEDIPYFEDENLKVHAICIEDTSKINQSKSDYAMSYICEPHLKKPPFLPNKALSLGLKPGPSYARLQNGHSVFLENGIEIKPEDVLGKQAP